MLYVTFCFDIVQEHEDVRELLIHHLQCDDTFKSKKSSNLELRIMYG